MWTPTRQLTGEGRAGRERNRQAPVRSTGVVSTACKKGDLGNWGRSGSGEGRTCNIIYRVVASPGSRIGSRYCRSRVTPVEGRTLTSDVLWKKERSGDWR